MLFYKENFRAIDPPELVRVEESCSERGRLLLRQRGRRDLAGGAAQHEHVRARGGVRRHHRLQRHRPRPPAAPPAHTGRLPDQDGGVLRVEVNRPHVE